MKNIGGAAVWGPVLPDEDPEDSEVSAMLVEGSRGGFSSVAVVFCPAVGPLCSGFSA